MQSQTHSTPRAMFSRNHKTVAPYQPQSRRNQKTPLRAQIVSTVTCSSRQSQLIQSRGTHRCCAHYHALGSFLGARADTARREQPRVGTHRAEDSTSLTGPGSFKKRTTSCPGAEVCADFSEPPKMILTPVTDVGIDRQDGAAEPASPRLLVDIVASRKQKMGALVLGEHTSNGTHTHATLRPALLPELRGSAGPVIGGGCQRE